MIAPPMDEVTVLMSWDGHRDEGDHADDAGGIVIHEFSAACSSTRNPPGRQNRRLVGNQALTALRFPQCPSHPR